MITKWEGKNRHLHFPKNCPVFEDFILFSALNNISKQCLCGWSQSDPGCFHQKVKNVPVCRGGSSDMLPNFNQQGFFDIISISKQRLCLFINDKYISPLIFWTLKKVYEHYIILKEIDAKVVEVRTLTVPVCCV